MCLGSCSMRIYCRDCGNKALITRVEEETAQYAKLYCICLEPTCGHGFISELRFSHTLKPSKILPADEKILDRILKLTGEQQKQLLEQLDMLT
ncbi:ogr/Delta-like zinc finger family protein [Pseudomonas sp. QTF5]|uniref:ogr/Delta-like zinc finger family protein n=1 Tax=Pseudomonas sp. QTF5 TaxID=1435425 RepID=UPI003531E449